MIAEVEPQNSVFMYFTSNLGTYIPYSNVASYNQENAMGNTITMRNKAGAVMDEFEYDAYGKPYTIAATTYRAGGYVGNKGYSTVRSSGMILCGARYYLPSIGRWLTQDPIGQSGGLNVYEYCGSNPVAKTDISGLTEDPIGGWRDGFHALFGFVFGLGPDRNVYTSQDMIGRQMRDSLMGQTVESSVMGMGASSGHFLQNHEHVSGDSSFGKTSFLAGHLIPFAATLLEPGNGTQAQVGGFLWDAVRIKNQVYFHIYNELTPRSLFLQIPLPSFNRSANGFGPMGTVTQDFYWSAPVPKAYRN